jgi:predicted house-cleaning noncanonical NTP pyrophosphatase (MazG superfamily)
MPKFKFNKLVRDKIVENQIASGAKPHYHVLSNEQHKIELVNKIIEETQEITKANRKDVAAEIADVQQAIDDLKEKFGLTDTDIAKAQKAKNKKNGPFKKGIYVDYVEINESDKWVKYYRQNADRYPEIK